MHAMALNKFLQGSLTGKATNLNIPNIGNVRGYVIDQSTGNSYFETIRVKR